MSRVLIIIPHDGFEDEEYESSLKVLKNFGHTVLTASSHHTEARSLKGNLIKPDVNIAFVEANDFECYIFIGGTGVEEFRLQTTLHNFIRSLFIERRLLCAIGEAVRLFVDAGVLAGRKVTCNPGMIPLVKDMGAYYSGGLTQQDGEIITASGVEASNDFALRIVNGLKWREDRKGPLK